MSANDRTGVGPLGPGSIEWGTPPDLYARLHRRYLFDYDPFASHTNAKCDLYSTMEGTCRRCDRGNGSFDPWHTYPAPVSAETPLGSSWERCRGYKQLDALDGLAADWTDRRVFCNPPYATGLIEKCIDKMIAERNRAALIVVLVNAATETGWFQRLNAAAHVEFLPKRVHYIHPPTRCVLRSGELCTHELNAPTKNTPGGQAVALLRAELFDSAEVLAARSQLMLELA